MSRHTLIAILFCLLGCAPPALASSAAEFRGYISINRVLRERIFQPGATFELGSYVGQTYNSTNTNLLDLLGTYKTGFGGGFRNGKPNSLNLLLWHLLLSELAKDIGKICDGERAKDFNETFVLHTEAFCSSSSDLRTSSEVAFNYWLALMGHDAPVSEFQIWERFLASPEMSGYRGAEAVEWATLSILNSPFFLLRQ